MMGFLARIAGPKILLGVVVAASLAIYYPVSEASAELLSYAGMGCLLLIAQYLGSSIVDIVRAWREQ